MMPVNRIIDVSLSPKGTSVAYTIKQYQKIDKHWQQAKFIEISSTKDHQNNIQLRQNNEEHSIPKYSPNGKRLAFLATQKSSISDDNKPTNASIKLWPLEKKKIYTLQKVTGDITDFAWSSNSESIAYIISSGEDANKDKNNPQPITVSLPQHSNALHIIEINYQNFKQSVDTTIISQAQGKDFSYVASFSWSPEGENIALCHDSGVGNDLWNHGKITLLNLGTLQQTPIKMPDMVMQQPMYSPDGRYLAFTAKKSSQW